MSDDDEKRDDNVVSLDKHRRGRAVLSVFAEILARWDTKAGGMLREAIDDTLTAKGVHLDWEAGEWQKIDAAINAGIEEGDKQLETLRAELELSHVKRVLDAKLANGQAQSIVLVGKMLLTAGEALRRATVMERQTFDSSGLRGSHRLCRICDGRFDMPYTSFPTSDGVAHKAGCAVLLYDQMRADATAIAKDAAPDNGED